MKKPEMSKLFFTLVVVAMGTILFGVFNKVPVQAAAIIIAASDSSSTWKSQATAVCTGTADQNTINTYLVAGNTVQLAPGTFNISGSITIKSQNHLYGQGNSTVLHLNSGNVYISDASNVELNSLKIEGSINPAFPGAVFIVISTSQSGYAIHDIACTATGSNDFFGYIIGNVVLSNLVFYNNDANSPDEMGFMLTGEGTTPTFQNVTFYNCSVENAGVASTRLLEGDGYWETGFDLAEYQNMVINHLQLIKCSVNGAWESDFHIESSPIITDAVFTGCSATNAGKKTGGALYGAGFLMNGLSQDVIFYNNTASANGVADIRAWNGSDYSNITPITNKIYPAGSSKTTVAISQGNCAGVLINIDSAHKELVMYSTDGNAVNQQIELGASYSADDGKTYTFNGTKIVAQFANYAVTRLVQTSISNLTVTTGGLSNGTVGVAYSQALTATGGASPYTWSIASGTLPVGLTLSLSGVISGTPTTAGGPASVTFKVTDNASGTSTKVLPITITTIPSISTITLPNATVGVAYSQTLTATGGTSPYTWSIASGTLPAGLTLNSSGLISGNPITAGGPVSITFKVSDSAGANASKSIPITVANTLDINKDGAVNILEMTSITQHWGETGTPGWIPQDVNNDGIINSLDMIIVGQHWTP